MQQNQTDRSLKMLYLEAIEEVRTKAKQRRLYTLEALDEEPIVTTTIQKYINQGLPTEIVQYIKSSVTASLEQKVTDVYRQKAFDYIDNLIKKTSLT